MVENVDLLLALCMALAAILYSSVGHAGASAYIALMALFGIEATVMRPTALVLNVIVASLASFRFLKAGLFSWRALWPFLVTAIPMAWLGGTIHLPSEIYRPLVGGVLWISAARLLWPHELKVERESVSPPLLFALPMGALIGLLAGLTGTGGGIFLSPLLLFMAWAPTRQVSGIAAVFVLTNSLAGLGGQIATLDALPPQLPLYAGAALIGGIIGTTIGIRVNTKLILKLLAVVLLIAGAKLIGLY
ncbi:sulfite exporter TauE/SafE family protein [Alteraurantiacibacter palmitatis]|uniref:Probable membrane transporter protein n=1 Tax=Alteraurantiacibacter palmitatis TaxID=2054628 RepID=A0ABV7E4F5_9SPHN